MLHCPCTALASLYCLGFRVAVKGKCILHETLLLKEHLRVGGMQELRELDLDEAPSYGSPPHQRADPEHAQLCKKSERLRFDDDSGSSQSIRCVCREL